MKKPEILPKIEEDKKRVVNEINEARNYVEKSVKSTWKELKPGDYVKIKDGNVIGLISKISKNTASVQTENFLIEVPIFELIKSQKPVNIVSYRSVNTNITESSRFDSTIDIRGYTKSEAIDTLHTMFDNAILANASILKILHGKGIGTLKTSYDRFVENTII